MYKCEGMLFDRVDFIFIIIEEEEIMYINII